MARIKSPEKRNAILQAAVREIAKLGLGAPTAKIARRAGLAAGTLFTYFANKEELLNELYLELKIEVYRRVNSNFPRTANLERRARHVWSSYLDWAIEFPEKRKVSAQLNVSDLITPETRMRAAAERGRSRNGAKSLLSEDFRSSGADYGEGVLVDNGDKMSNQSVI